MLFIRFGPARLPLWWSITVSLLVLRIQAAANFFSYRQNPTTWNNQGWAQICYDFSDYTPTCGWQLILTSDMALDNIEVWDSTAVKEDDYTFFMYDIVTNDDLLSNPPHTCPLITINGPFGNAEPEIHVTWHCVCTPDTDGLCEIVAPSPLLGSVSSTTTSAATVVTASPTLYPGHLLAAPNRLLMSKQESSCYLGETTASFTTWNLIVCGTSCLRVANCAGVNFYESSGTCAFVPVNTDLNPSSVGPLTGCIYWKVIYKL